MSFGIPVRNGLGLGLTPSTTLSSGRTGPRPALTLNFLTSTALSSNVTFSRGTQATLTDSTGKITYAPNNLLTNSESFEAAAWGKVGGSVTANTVVAPDGTSTADTYAEDTASSLHYSQQAVSGISTGQTVTGSFYFKAGTRTYAVLSLYNTTSNNYAAASFDLLTGAVANTAVAGTGISITSTTVTSAGNGWYRCAITAVAGTNTFIRFGWGVSADGTVGGTIGFPTYLGTSGTLFIWGAQLEAVTYQTTPGTYNSTTPKNLLGYTQEFDNAAWTKSNSFVQTNLLTYSQDFDNAAWSKGLATVTANTSTAPDGTTTADTITVTAGAGNHYVQQARIGAATAGVQYAISFYVKKAASRYILVGEDGDASVHFAVFDLDTGTYTNTTNATTIAAVPFGNGWYRIGITYTRTNSGNIYPTVIPVLTSNASSFSYTATGSETVIVWGAQLVQGATAGDYQPTYAAAAAVQYAAPDGTLSADKLVETTANAFHGATQILTLAGPMTLSCYLKADTRNFAAIRTYDGTNGDRYVVFNLSTGTVGVTSGGTTGTITAVGNGWYRCAMSYNFISASGSAGVTIQNANSYVTYTGDGTSGVFIWGAQLSNSASLDPYVYNPGAAPTSAAYYGPRFDYDPVTLAAKGLLIEEQRTNLTTYSEQFNNAAWGLNAASATPNVTTAPDGTTTADKLVEGASTATHGLDAPAAAITAGTTYTGSLYAKASERRYLFVALTYSGFTSGNGVCFDLQTGTIVGSGTGSASAGAITPVGNGWYRCSITLAATVSGTFIGAPAVYLSDTATNSLKSYTGDGTSGAFVWGAQLEAGAFATSYIPTVASTVTRSADVATMTGTNFSSWYNQTQGAFVVSGDSAGGAVSGLYEASTSGTAAQSISVRLGQKFSYAQGLNRFDFSYTAGNVIRHGFAYLAGNYGAAVGGTALAVNANGQPADVPAGANQLALGCLGSGTFLLNGHIRTLSYYNTRLTNTQLQALTA